MNPAASTANVSLTLFEFARPAKQIKERSGEKLEVIHTSFRSEFYSKRERNYFYKLYSPHCRLSAAKKARFHPRWNRGVRSAPATSRTHCAPPCYDVTKAQTRSHEVQHDVECDTSGEYVWQTGRFGCVIILLKQIFTFVLRKHFLFIDHICSFLIRQDVLFLRL